MDKSGVCQIVVDYMISKILRRTTNRSIVFRVAGCLNTKKQFMEKLANKEYLEILGIGEKEKANIRGKDLHEAYIRQIKRYHSDMVHDELSKTQNEQITKCITQAFDALKKNDPTYRQSYKNQSTYTFQDQAAQKLYGKTFQEIKYDLYKEGNQEMRKEFVAEVQRRKNQNKEENSHAGTASPQQHNDSYRSGSSSGSQSFKGIGAAVLVCLGLVPFLYSSSNKPKLKDKDGKEISFQEQAKDLVVRQYTDQQYDIMLMNNLKMRSLPFQRFINALGKRRPHMRSYPIGEDPDIMEQLTEYSIAPDIHLFEVSPNYFISDDGSNDLNQLNSVEKMKKYELTQTKPNTLLSLSLQAERTLQNIYVKVDDVLREIKTNGKFTPPKVLFKFRGYMMFELREMPISSLQNFRNSNYISLFDLYFDFYSPIFFKRSYYNMYLTGFDEEKPKDTRYFGNVQLNHRRLPSVYLEKGQKVVIMNTVQKAKNQFGRLKESQIKYMQIWENYYQKYQKKWKQYCQHQTPSLTSDQASS